MLSNQCESSNGHKLQKVLEVKIVKILILFTKFIGDFILEKDFFVTSFVFGRARFDNSQASLPSVILDLKLNSGLHL